MSRRDRVWQNQNVRSPLTDYHKRDTKTDTGEPVIPSRMRVDRRGQQPPGEDTEMDTQVCIE